MKKYLEKVLFDDIFATYESIISSISTFLNSPALQYDFLTTQREFDLVILRLTAAVLLLFGEIWRDLKTQDVNKAFTDGYFYVK